MTEPTQQQSSREMIGNINGEYQPLYAFYDKTKETQNNGWAWFHRDLSLDDINKCYQDELRQQNGDIISGVPNAVGTLRFNSWTVCFAFCPAGKDEKGRDHWVLITAWLPKETTILEIRKVIEGGVFKSIQDGNHDLPNELQHLDYVPEWAKAAYEGGALVQNNCSWDAFLDFIEKIRNRKAVDVIFARRTPNGKVKIVTKRRESV